MEVLPESANVDVTAPPHDGGLVGTIEAVHVALDIELGDEAPGSQELLCISGVAFKNYVFEPEFNRFEEPVRAYSSEAHFVCNYGPFESLAYFTGFDIKEFNGISRDDFWKLLRFELASGRPAVSMGLKGPLQPILVTGYDESDNAPTVTVQRARAEATEEVDLTGESQMQGESESFSNWLVIVRPGEAVEWTPSANRQRMRVLRWAEAHARRPKEFSQETRENYAPGLGGFESFQNFLEGHEPSDFDDEGLRDYTLTHVEELARGRRAAAARLPWWGEDLRDDEDIELDDASTLVELYASTAGEYADVAEPLEHWLDEHDTGTFDPESLEALRGAHALARDAEREAVDRLQQLVGALPNLF